MLRFFHYSSVLSQYQSHEFVHSSEHTPFLPLPKFSQQGCVATRQLRLRYSLEHTPFLSIPGWPRNRVCAQLGTYSFPSTPQVFPTRLCGNETVAVEVQLGTYSFSSNSRLATKQLEFVHSSEHTPFLPLPKFSQQGCGNETVAVEVQLGTYSFSSNSRLATKQSLCTAPNMLRSFHFPSIPDQCYDHEFVTRL